MPRTRHATEQGDLSALLPAFDRDPIYKPRKPRAKRQPPPPMSRASNSPAPPEGDNPPVGGPAAGGAAGGAAAEEPVDEGLKQFGTLIASSFAEALRNIGTSDAAVKHRTPDTFSGTDPYKLRSFLAQCELYFRANAKKFPTDEKKVLFAFTYLSDVALEWFEQKFANAQSSLIPDSISQDENDEEEAAEYITTLGQVRSRRFRENDWVTSWEAFVYEISTHFGPADDEGDAERQLNNLSMPSDKRILWYNVRFNRFSARTGWDDRALCYRYYNGLPDRLQDAITSDGKPRRLSEMKKLALKWDQRYWERQGEKRKQSDKDKKPQKPATTTTSSSTSANPSSSSQSASTSNNNNNNRGRNPAPKHNNSNSASTASGSKNSLSDKLGSDGKLTPAERARRLANKLCLFCGNAGHRASECRKAMKARAAKADTPKADAPKANSDTTSGKA